MELSKQQNTPDEQEARQWAMFLHLSQLASYLIPLIGLIAPILIWQLKKEQFPELDAHGKVVVNWLISAIIYFAISFALTFVLIGFVMLFALSIAAIVFPVIGGIKANNGELWPYPLTITFIK